EEQRAMAHPIIDVAMTVDVPLERAFGAVDVEREGLHAPVVVGHRVGEEPSSALEECVRRRQRVGVGVGELGRRGDTGHALSSRMVVESRAALRYAGRRTRSRKWRSIGPPWRLAMTLVSIVRRVVLPLVVVAVVTPGASPPPGAQPATPAPHQRLLREIYQELVEINTTDSVGDNTKAAEAMARRLFAAGFPTADVQVLVSAPRKGNLVARLHGTGARRPLLLLAHLDVVEANREDWSIDPFTLLERDGYFYGRGTTDDKAMAAVFVTNLIRYRQEGFVPDRDIIVALTADEEGGGHNGVAWLLANHRALIDAELALNEGAGGAIKNGVYLSNNIQASEKIPQNYRLEVKNPGGHSSLPVKDNAITHLAAGLARLGAFDFPVRLDDVKPAYFERPAAVAPGPLGRNMRAIPGRTDAPALRAPASG